MAKRKQNPPLGIVRGYVRLSAAWYGPECLASRGDVLDDVLFGYKDPSPDGPPVDRPDEFGKGEGLACLRWNKEGGKPILYVHSDEWWLMAACTDVLAELGDTDPTAMTPDAFCALLNRYGFRDQTAKAEPAWARKLREQPVAGTARP
jgi:hypothetical protein